MLCKDEKLFPSYIKSVITRIQRIRCSLSKSWEKYIVYEANSLEEDIPSWLDQEQRKAYI